MGFRRWFFHVFTKRAEVFPPVTDRDSPPAVVRPGALVRIRAAGPHGPPDSVRPRLGFALTLAVNRFRLRGFAVSALLALRDPPSTKRRTVWRRLRSAFASAEPLSAARSAPVSSRWSARENGERTERPSGEVNKRSHVFLLMAQGHQLRSKKKWPRET